MSNGPDTSWTSIRAAGAGDDRERAEFARRYAPAVEAYLRRRWSASAFRQDLADAVQDVFVECLRPGGVLQKAVDGGPGGFRALLYAVTRNVARRFEERRSRRREQPAPTEGLDVVDEDETTLSVAFDRAWAESVLRDAARLQERKARDLDEAAQRRVELLRLRFQDGLPIREIARRWEVDAARLHHEYARARSEFEQALIEVVTSLHPPTSGSARDEAARLIGLLG